MADGCADGVLRAQPARLPRGRDPGRRQDDVRPDGGRRAAGAARRSSGSPSSRPTEHLKTQWAEAAAKVGIPLDPAYSGRKGRTSSDFVGVAHDVRRRGGEPAGAPHPHRALQHAGHPRRGAPRGRRAVVGRGGARGVRAGASTPRADRHAVPLRHQPDPVRHLRPGRRRGAALGGRLHLRLRARAGRPRRAPGAVHGLQRADAVAHAGRRRGGRAARRAADQGHDRARPAHGAGPEGCLDPVGARGGRPPALRGAPARARRRRTGDRHATRSPRAPTPRCWPGSSGEKPTVVLSDEKAASKKIAKFTDDGSRWMVAVRMVSEGVDVPRLAVGVYATTTSTPLFFAQAVGRFVRARKRGETASIFVPSVPLLLAHASEMEVERDHVLGRKITDEDDIFAAEDDLLARAQAAEGASDERARPFEAMGSEAPFDRVLYDGGGVRPRGRGARRVGGGDGLPRDPGPARARPGARPAPSPAERAGPSYAAARSRCPSASTTDARAAGGDAPRAQRARRGVVPPHRPAARRSPTPRCARSAAARPPRQRTPPSWRSGSTCCASGRRRRAPSGGPQDPDQHPDQGAQTRGSTR